MTLPQERRARRARIRAQVAALARGGSGGEAVNAQRVLDRMNAQDRPQPAPPRAERPPVKPILTDEERQSARDAELALIIEEVRS